MAGPAARAFSDSGGMLTAFAKRTAKESVVRVSRGSPFPPREPRTNPGAILADWRHTQLGEDDPTVQSGQDDATPRYTSDISSCVLADSSWLLTSSRCTDARNRVISMVNAGLNASCTLLRLAAKPPHHCCQPAVGERDDG